MLPKGTKFLFSSLNSISLGEHFRALPFLVRTARAQYCSECSAVLLKPTPSAPKHLTLPL